MFLSREDARSLDRRASEELGIPGMVLMENAGRGAAAILRSLNIPGPVALCCGKGNNGGDGCVIARHLASAGFQTQTLLFARPDELTGDAAANYRILARLGARISVLADGNFDDALRSQLATSAWIVDALFGTGLTGPVRPPFDRVIAAINASGVRVLAVDIPSGLDCDSGRPLGPTVRATHTVTFAAEKKGFAEPAARQWLGRVHVVDIGVPSVLWGGNTPSAPSGRG